MNIFNLSEGISAYGGEPQVWSVLNIPQELVVLRIDARLDASEDLSRRYPCYSSDVFESSARVRTVSVLDGYRAERLLWGNDRVQKTQ